MEYLERVRDFAKRWIRNFSYMDYDYLEFYDDDHCCFWPKVNYKDNFGKFYGEAKYSFQEFARVADSIGDIYMLGEAVCDRLDEFLEENDVVSLRRLENRMWFMAAFQRLGELTGYEMMFPFGRLIRFSIVSDLSGEYGPLFVGREMKQEFSINKDGRVKFSMYVCGEDYEYVRAVHKVFDVDKDLAAKILFVISVYFTKDYTDVLAYDTGCWTVNMTDANKRKYKFCGSVLDFGNVNGINLSDFVRRALDMPELCFMDRNYVSQGVARVSVSLKSGDKDEFLCVDIVDNFIEYRCCFKDEFSVSKKFVHKDVKGILREIDFESLVASVKGQGPYRFEIVSDSDEIRCVESDFDRLFYSNLWNKFINKVNNLMENLDGGRIFSPDWNKDEVMICKVTFGGGDKEYSYICNDFSVERGDLVVVPVGHYNRRKIAKVSRVEFVGRKKLESYSFKLKTVIEKFENEELFQWVKGEA